MMGRGNFGDFVKIFNVIGFDLEVVVLSKVGCVNSYLFVWGGFCEERVINRASEKDCEMFDEILGT